MPGRSNASVLLVTANGRLRDFVAELLRDRGFRVLHASDGKVAVGMARATRMRLVILWVGVPGDRLFLEAKGKQSWGGVTPVLLVSDSESEQAIISAVDRTFTVD